MQKWVCQELPEPLPLKRFKQTNTELPELDDYSGALPTSYWSCWEKKTYEELGNNKSWISPEKLFFEAKAVGFTGREGRIKRAMERLTLGADIGCRGDGRLPTEQPNSASANVFGVRVADSLQSWIKEGLCFGPLDRHEMPWKE